MTLKCAPCVIAVTETCATPESLMVALTDLASAVTQIGGTMVCAEHAVDTARTPGAARDLVLRGQTVPARARRDGLSVPRVNTQTP